MLEYVKNGELEYVINANKHGTLIRMLECCTTNIENMNACH